MYHTLDLSLYKSYFDKNVFDFSDFLYTLILLKQIANFVLGTKNKDLSINSETLTTLS